MSQPHSFPCSGRRKPANKRKCLFLLLLVLCALFLPCLATALPLERLDIGATAVLDTANILKTEERKALEDRLRDLHQRRLMQVAVVIVDSTDGTPIFDYGMKIAEKWKLGEAGRDNGLLILIAVRDRKYHTFTGYGLEGVLTDVSLSRIQHDAFPSNFRENRYAQGINLALDGMEKRLTADTETLKKLQAEDKRMIQGDPLTNIITALFLIGSAALVVFLIIWAIEACYTIPRYVTAPLAGLLFALIAFGSDQGPVITVITGMVAALLYIPFARWVTMIDQMPSPRGSGRHDSGYCGSRSSGGSSSGGYSGGGGRFGGGGSGGGW